MRQRRPEYLIEVWGWGVFMVSACGFARTPRLAGAAGHRDAVEGASTHIERFGFLSRIPVARQIDEEAKYRNDSKPKGKSMMVQQFDLIIVGAGSGNTIPGADHQGWEIALVEQDKFGGTCLNRGCLPSKMLIYAAEVAETIHTAETFGITAEVSHINWDRIIPAPCAPPWNCRLDLAGFGPLPSPPFRFTKCHGQICPIVGQALKNGNRCFRP